MQFLQLKKHEDRRIRAGHPWIFSNEIDTKKTPLKSFQPGDEVLLTAHDGSPLGIAYVNPHSLIAARLLTPNPEETINVDFFKTRLTAALQLRECLFDQPYYRLIFSEADGLPGLIIDRFDNDFVVQINTAGMEVKQSLIAEALQAVFPNLRSILLRNDSGIREQEGLANYVKPLLGTPPEEVIIKENNTEFYLPLLRGQKTGWFYDHRMNRARLHAYVKNQAVLDVFSYLGAWGIEAAKFGASLVDCIETSQFAADYITKNAALNNVQEKVRVICDDAFDAMKKLVQEKKHYGVIILDPPAFVKKAKDHKEGLLAYQRINELALKLLAPNGILITCSCSMHVSMEELSLSVQRAANRLNQSIQVLERGHQAPDHPLHPAIPETDYLKAIVVRRIT